MNLSRAFIALLFVGAVLASGGCTSGSKQVAVKGTVHFDGSPVEEGSISFFPEDGEARKASAAIINGEFAIPAERGPAPGKFKVEISWMRKTGKKIPSADPGIEIDERKEVIPAKYNTASTLLRDITSGDNTLEIRLEK